MKLKNKPLNYILRVGLAALVVLVLMAEQLGTRSPTGTGNIASLTIAPAAHANGGSTIYLPLAGRDFPLQTPFGIQSSGIDEANGLSQMVTGGVNWIRSAGITWSEVEPAQGARNWSALASIEQQFINASVNHLTPIIIVSSTPTWAQSVAGRFCGPIRSDKLAAFASFVHDVVARYSGPPYNIHYWELWNEPDAPYNGPTAVGDPASAYGCWGDSTDAYYGGRYYAEMLKQVYPQIKAADPSAQVLTGGLLLECNPNFYGAANCPSGKFFEGVLLNGGGNYFDGVSFHAYDYYTSLGEYGQYQKWGSRWDLTGPATIAKGQYLKGLLAKYNVTGKYLLNTEAAVLCPSAPTTLCDSASIETTKAYYVPQLYATTLAEGLRATLWYAWDDDWRQQSMMDATYTPKPVYYAFQFAAQELRGAKFTQEIKTYAGVKAYEFNRGDRRIWIVWSFDGNPHQLTLPATPSAAYDSDGTPLTPTGTPTITLEPSYLEWP